MTTASKTPKAEPVRFETFAADIAARRAALGGVIEVPRNGGGRRTESKRGLLAAIESRSPTW